MSAPGNEGRDGALDRVIEEARGALVPPAEPDWGSIEERLMSRIAADAAGARAGTSPAHRTPRLGVAVTGALALAAGVLLLVGRSARVPSAELSDARPSIERETAMVREKGAGEVRLPSRDHVRLGDVIETSGARAFFKTTGAGATQLNELKATWAMEDGSRVSVRRTSGALILALDSGAVEAQVTPVPNGEAFGVDVDGVRVAVHGTHLRVHRGPAGSPGGTRVIVDLTEGVVSIGPPPRIGSTLGPALVNAPAHIEFDPTNLTATLTIDHSPSAVREAVSLDAEITFAEGAPSATSRTDIGEVTGHPSAAPRAPLQAPRLANDTTKDGGEPGSRAPLSSEDAVRYVAQVVLACAANRPPSTDEVKVTVSSMAALHVDASGKVASLRFTPPLSPELQSCAAASIYEAQFASRGLLEIPLTVQR